MPRFSASLDVIQPAGEAGNDSMADQGLAEVSEDRDEARIPFDHPNPDFTYSCHAPIGLRCAPPSHGPDARPTFSIVNQMCFGKNPLRRSKSGPRSAPPLVHTSIRPTREEPRDPAADDLELPPRPAQALASPETPSSPVPTLDPRQEESIDAMFDEAWENTSRMTDKQRAARLPRSGKLLSALRWLPFDANC